MFWDKKEKTGAACDIHIDYIRKSIEETHAVIKEHINSEDIKMDKIETKIDELKEISLVCPETGHIQEQNGKLANLIKEVYSTKARVTVISSIFIALMTAVLIKLFKYM